MKDFGFENKEISRNLEKMKESLLDVIVRINNIVDNLNEFKLPELTYEEQLNIASNYKDFLVLAIEQKIILKEFCAELSSFLPFNDYIIMGFIKKGMRKWQKDNDQPIMVMIRMNIVQRIQVMGKILYYAFTCMQRAIYIPVKQIKEEFFKKAYRIAIEYYEELLSLQHLITNQDSDDLSLYL